MKPLWSAERVSAGAIRVICNSGQSAATWVSAYEWEYANDVERRYLLTAAIHRVNRTIEALNNENRT